MASLVQLGKYGAINAEDPNTMGYYVIKYLSEPYTLKQYQTTYGKVSKAGELAVKEEYLSIMKAKTNSYWQQNGMKQSVMISTRTIVHPCLDNSDLNNYAYITSSVCNKKQARQAVHRQPFHISDADHYYILDEIQRRDHIKYEIQIHNDGG